MRKCLRYSLIVMISTFSVAFLGCNNNPGQSGADAHEVSYPTGDGVSHPSGAAARALAMQQAEESAEELLGSIGLYCSTNDKELCIEFYYRAQSNSELKRALEQAEEMGVNVYISNRGDNNGVLDSHIVTPGVISLNAAKSDKHIIEFLRTGR